jgi:hypothetical protein
VSYEWDPAKARANFKKHGIYFADAATVFEDDLALTIRDPFAEPDAEPDERWITIGQDANARILVVVYAWREDRIRMISARFATPRERSQYEKRHEA